MKLTKHAAKRAQQRGLPMDLLLLIALFGDVVAEDKEGLRLQILDKTRSKIIQLLDKSREKILITDKDYESIITAYALGR